MIFKQVREIVAGTKRQTRRMMKPGETYAGHGLRTVLTPGGRIKWQVGRDYAVVSYTIFGIDGYGMANNFQALVTCSNS